LTRRRAYAPYSNYAVGAALLAASGEVYEGVNVENAAFPAGMCAERTALFTAVTQGEREFSAIAVVTENGGTPCGSCRQALSEFGLAMVVVVADAEGNVVHEIPLGELLPEAFGPSKLAH
jgi:cytidine deaminase